MAKQKSLEEELHSWKEKYFELKESLADQQKDEDAFRSVLQRMLLRLCLSAEGQSSSFDDELTRFRSDVRRTDISVYELAKRLNDLDTALSEVDSLKNKNGKRYADLIREMSEQLEAFKPPSSDKKALKKIVKMMRRSSLKAEQFLPVLADYSEAQKSTLRWLQEQTPDQPGLMQRLFGSKSASSDQDNNRSVKPDRAENSEARTDTSTHEYQIEIGDTQIPSGSESEPADISVISSQVRTALNCLLDQLTFPENSQRALKSLRDKISGPLNWTELGVTLDDLSSIIISAVGRGQRDFGSFLSDIEERLDLIQNVVMATLQSGEKLRDEERALDKNVRHHISNMQETLEKESELEGLKNSIKSQVDNIYSVLDNFSEISNVIHDSKEKDYETLQARFDALEKESHLFREQLKEERAKALTDSLTQLPNREAYDERFMLEYDRWKRYKKPITLVLADIDHFKSINDDYGHLSGDKVLQILAKEFSSRLRATDFVARYGGEEFVLLLPETDIETAQTVINKTREIVSRLPFHFREEKVQVTASFGIVAFAEGLEPQQLFDAADRALYKAKDNGRNCVEVSQTSDKKAMQD